MRCFSKSLAFIFLATGIAVVVLAASWLVYVNYLAVTSPFWDNGRWSEAQMFPFATSNPVEFDDKLFMFYSEITKDTISKEDDVITPDEYQLVDVFYRTFDGANYNDVTPLSSPDDEVSVHADCLVYNGKLYAMLSEEWIANFSSYEWSSRVRMMSFDGLTWRDMPGPFGENEQHWRETYFVYGGEVWAMWQRQEPNVYMPNSFAYKTFDGSVWSAPQNFSFPTGQPDIPWKTAIADGKLWFAWKNVTLQTFKPPYVRHEDIYVGCFDGEKWTNVTMLSSPDDEGLNSNPLVVRFKDELFAFWTSEHFGSSELVLRRFNLSNGALSELARANPEPEYKIGGARVREYDGKLYVLGNGGLIRSFNGTAWSSVYEFPDRNYGGLFILDSKLWVYTSTSEGENQQTIFKSYHASIS